MVGTASPNEVRGLLEAIRTVHSRRQTSDVLQAIADAGTKLVDARFGVLGVLNRERTHLAQYVTAGIDEAGLRAIEKLPEGEGILQLLIRDQTPLRLPNLHDHPQSEGFPSNHPLMTSFLGVAIVLRGEAFGNLYLWDKRGDAEFSEVDEVLTIALAEAGAIAIENAELHERLSEHAMVEERERIARDLHDTVIQRLFATGLRLQATLPLITDRGAVVRLTEMVGDLDETIREVRSAIFELHTVRLPGASVRATVLDLCRESGRAMGFAAAVRFEGAIDSSINDVVADHLLAVLREILSNVGHHAAASNVKIAIATQRGLVELRVDDDGVGIRSDAPPGRGIANLRAHAVGLGGEAHLANRIDGGTSVTWTVPLGLGAA